MAIFYNLLASKHKYSFSPYNSILYHAYTRLSIYYTVDFKQNWRTSCNALGQNIIIYYLYVYLKNEKYEVGREIDNEATRPCVIINRIINKLKYCGKPALLSRLTEKGVEFFRSLQTKKRTQSMTFSVVLRKKHT